MAGNKEALFEYLDTNFRAVAADELTIVNERPSELDWRRVNIASPLSRTIVAPVPILTSPMTTISGDAMGIAAAKEGGAAVIHHANTPEEQKRLVRRVKLHLNGMIDEPVTVRASETVGSALERLSNQGHDFRTLPVLDDEGTFVGLMTNTYFKLFRGQNGETSIDEAMVPAEEVGVLTASPDDINSPQSAYDLMRERRSKLLILLSEARELKGMYLLNDVLRVVEGNPQKYNLDPSGRLRTAMSVSTYDQDAIDRVRASARYLDLVVVDTSHAESPYSFSTLEALKQVRKTVKNLREEFGAIDIMVGNVSDPFLASELAKEGPDAIRVGRGPGGICISREKLGGGTPQATAVYECAKAVHAIDSGIAICADGGIRGPGDFVKYLALDASCIMVGSYVAGTDEAAAPVMTRGDNSQYKEYNGMGSAKEQLRSAAARSRYDTPGPSEGAVPEDEELFVEGVEKEIPLQGPVARKFHELVRGAKTEMATGGFADIAALQAGVSFKLVTAAAALEGKASR